MDLHFSHQQTVQWEDEYAHNEKCLSQKIENQEMKTPTEYLLRQLPHFIQPLQEMIFDIAEGTYSTLISDGRANYLSEDNIRAIISIYPRQISMSPQEELLNNPCLLIASKYELDPRVSCFRKEDICESLWNVSILFWDKYDGGTICGDLELELEVQVDQHGKVKLKIEQLRIS